MACASALLFSPAAGAGTATFTGIGDLPGGDFESYTAAVSPDGGTVVGTSRALDQIIAHCCWWHEETSRDAAFRWTASEGMVEIVDGYAALAASLTGDVVGRGLGGNFRWSPAGGYELLEDLGGNPQVKDVSGNGNFIVGSSLDPTGNHIEAFRWSDAGGLEYLGTLPHTNPQSVAASVSADGSVITGISRSRSFLWTAETGIVQFVPGGNDAPKVSPDGGTIFGNGYVWTEEEGTIPVNGIVNAASRFGSVAVGVSQLPLTNNAFLWDRANGARDMKDILENHYGLDLTGWALTNAVDVSIDGRTIVGTGQNPAGDREGWVVVLPPQCDDGFDNDGDGLGDALDPQCSNPTWNDESKAPAPACGLGFELVALVPLLHRIRRSRRA